MTRLLALFTGVLLLVTGCGKTEEPPAAECDYEDLDLTQCDTSTLGSLQADGIWNMNLTFAEGDTAPAVIRFSGEPQIAGLPMSDKRVESDVFLLTSEVQTVEQVPRTVRYLFAGCRASAPTQVQGTFRRCTSGKKDLEGTFEAKRVLRREGEAEASGVELVSELALPNGSARDIFLAGGYAYVAAREAGLYIFDISNPQAPTLAKALELNPTDNDAWHQVWVKNQTLYVASSKRGVLVFDLTNPKDPVSPKGYPTPGVDVRALAIDGDFLYAASPSPNAEVLILDLTKPREPVVAKRYFVEETDPSLGDLPWDVAVSGGRLYVSHGFYGLAVSNVADPRQPKLLGRYAYTGADTRTALVGTFGFRTLAFEAGEGWGAHLKVLNVSSPELITKGGEFKLRSEVAPSSMALVGTKLYVAHYQDGLRVLNVTEADTLEPLGYYNTWRESDGRRGNSFFEGASDVEAPGDGYLYVAETSRGLVILREQP
ncbi:LVIVD repeat-containing protein [Hyalangium rubrum]|uniref:Lipoprotein n=1 Tax=Hyalangium rubrum TaxID=3103134 RepID=A0ABU5GWI7_9BACT|nr:hypothetical protein [Hyalangium sp. s54d21]MDY7225557.1 hypothetical protein [Hyalangium sp. s54d21]